MCVWRMSLRRTKSAIISWAGSFNRTCPVTRNFLTYQTSCGDIAAYHQVVNPILFEMKIWHMSLHTWYTILDIELKRKLKNKWQSRLFRMPKWPKPILTLSTWPDTWVSTQHVMTDLSYMRSEWSFIQHALDNGWEVGNLPVGSARSAWKMIPHALSWLFIGVPWRGGVY